MLVPATLQNESNWSKEKSTIIIENGSPEWNEAYSNWINMKNPTESKEWNKGVFMTFKEKENA